MTLPDSETVEYDILIQATLALKNLADLTNATKSFDQQLAATTMQVKNSAAQWGVSFQQAKNTLQGIDKEISGTAESSVLFGARGQEAWTKVGDSAEKAGKTTQKATQSMAGGINIVRTALHLLVSSAIFAVIGAFAKLFSMAITGLREMETATYNMVNAEKKLSESGVDITPKGLDETIKKLQEIDPLLSKIQATELVSRVSSLVAPAVGLKADEIEQLSRSIAVLAVRNKGLGKSFEEVESQVSNAFLSGRVSVGINQLGVKITDQIVKDEALRLGLVKTSDEYDNLTGKMESNIKARAMLSVLAQNTNKEQEHLPEYLKTADAQFGIFQARLQDLLTQVGKLFGPLLIKGFEALINALEVSTAILEKMSPIIERVVASLSGLFAGIKNNPLVPGQFDLNKFADQYAVGFKEAEDSFKEFGDYADTTTAKVAEDVTANLEDAQKEFEKFKDKLDDIISDYKRKEEDLNIQQGRKVEDLDIEYSSKNADAAKDYQRKLEDINQDSQDKIADIKNKARLEEQSAEKKHLQELERLRDQYLMDLEDALRNRDARQVLKLQKEYEMNKNHLNQQNEDEKKQRQLQTEQDIKQAKKDRDRKIRDAKIEYERKLDDLKLAKQREYDEITRWRQREEDDLKRATNRRITDMVNEYMQSKFFTQSYLNDLLAMVQSFSNQMNLMRDEWYSLQPGTLGTASGTLGTASSGTVGHSTGGGLSNTSKLGSASGGGLAEGGTFLATRPATINVAENRPEIIQATPLGKPGADITKLFSNMPMNGDGQSNIRLRIGLSDGLIAEIVDGASNNIATTIEKIRRER